jgi:hypothetical protein
MNPQCEHTKVVPAGNLSRRDMFLCAVGLCVLLLGVVVEATLHRNLEDPELQRRAASCISEIPADIGNWNSRLLEIDDREKRIAGIAGSVRREYRNQHSGQTVVLTVLNGSAGPMSVHPPAACFEGVGYTLIAGPSVVDIRDDKGHAVTLNRAVFRQGDGAVSESVRVYWGWSTDGQWEAPANPRFTFRGEPNLFKVYVIDRNTGGTDKNSPGEAFIKETSPVIRHTLAKVSVSKP